MDYLNGSFISVACNSEKSAIKEALKESLVDPGSLVIDKVVTSDDSRRDCIKYNSKNKLGIYVGKKTVVLKKISTQWAVQDTDVYASSCTNAGFKQLDEMEHLMSYLTPPMSFRQRPKNLNPC